MAGVIKFYMYPEKQGLFFEQPLVSMINSLQSALTPDDHMAIFPEAMLKTPGLPNGLAVTSPFEKAILLPTLLRDPGCGFLLFKIKFNQLMPTGWQHTMGAALHELMNAQPNAFQNISIKDRLQHGLKSLIKSTSDRDRFSILSCPVDMTKINMTDEEKDLIQADNEQLTNTLEIKKVGAIYQPKLLKKYDLKENDYIGFIHSGTDRFPGILGKRFYKKIADYAFYNHLFSVAQIRSGVFGVHLNSSLGYDYYQWINAAMNFAITNRYLIYSRVKKFLENYFRCEVSIINDQVHAGLFLNDTTNGKILESVRGIQKIKPQKNYLDLILLAGQKETVSFLAIGVNKKETLASHGTSYQISTQFNYHAEFAKDEIAQYLDYAGNAFYNTEPNLNDCIPLTYNLLLANRYFQENKLSQPAAMLIPLINIQSNSLVAKLTASAEREAA